MISPFFATLITIDSAKKDKMLLFLKLVIFSNNQFYLNFVCQNVTKSHDFSAGSFRHSFNNIVYNIDYHDEQKYRCVTKFLIPYNLHIPVSWVICYMI